MFRYDGWNLNLHFPFTTSQCLSNSSSSNNSSNNKHRNNIKKSQREFLLPSQNQTLFSSLNSRATRNFTGKLSCKIFDKFWIFPKTHFLKLVWQRSMPGWRIPVSCIQMTKLLWIGLNKVHSDSKTVFTVKLFKLITNSELNGMLKVSFDYLTIYDESIIVNYDLQITNLLILWCWFCIYFCICC